MQPAKAVAVNLCGGLVLMAWLIFGQLNLPIQGQLFLWILAGMLIVISGIELFVYRQVEL